MIPFIVLVAILVVFGGIGFAVHVLWVLLVVALIAWLLGFLFRAGGTRGWYRW